MDVNIKQLEIPSVRSTKVEQLTFGFIREIEQTLNTAVIVPAAITMICIEYGITLFAWFGVYDAMRSAIAFGHHKEQKYSQYQVLKGLPSTSVAADIIFVSKTGFNEGVHDITMQCIRSHPNDKFGIVENGNVGTLTNFGRIYLYNEVFKQRYYWW